MKILFVAPRYHTNQAQIVKALVNNGHKVSFHCVLKGVVENYELITPCLIAESRVSRVIRHLIGDGGPNLRRFFPSLIGYWSTIANEAPDIAIIRLHGCVFNYMAACFARLVRARVIFYDQIPGEVLVENLESGWKSYLRRTIFYGRLVLFKSAWMTPICSQHKLDKLPPGCYYVPFAVPILGRATNQPVQKTLRFLMIGKYLARKNHLLLLEAAKMLACNFDFHITVIGECTTSSHHHTRSLVEKSIIELNLEKHITLEESVPHSSISNLYRDHDVFVLPASNEPASVSVLEALGCGIPVICSDTCGTKTYIRDGLDGLIFSSDCAASLASKMQLLISDRDLVLRMSSYAHEYAKSNISCDSYYAHFTYLLSDRFGLKLR